MKKSTNLIYYVAGCYGTFVEWLCTTVTNGGKVNADLPYTSTGSSHNFVGNPLWLPGKLFADIESDTHLNFARCHPSIFETVNSKEIAHNNSYLELVRQDLSFLEKHYNKILVLHPTTTTILWQENNFLDKVRMDEAMYNSQFRDAGYTKDFFSELFPSEFNKRIIETLRKEISEGKTIAWSKSDLDNMDVWEIRELMSFYWFRRQKDMFTCWNQLSKEFLNIKFMPMDDFDSNFCNSTIDYLNYFEVKPPSLESIKAIEAEWRPRQVHINKDNQVRLIINSIIDNYNYDWCSTDLTLIDEAYIQKNLRILGIKIECYNLNKFPTNTKEFSLSIKS